MSDDQNQPPTGEGKPGPTDGESRSFTQRDLDHVAAKERRAAQALSKELEEARAKLAAVDEANKTEQQRQVEAAIKKAEAARDAAWEPVIKQTKLQAAIDRAVDKHGIHEDFVPSVMALIKDVDDPKEIAEAVEKIAKDKPHFTTRGSHTPGPVQPGAPGIIARSGVRNSKELADFIAANGARAVTPEMWEAQKRFSS